MVVKNCHMSSIKALYILERLMSIGMIEHFKMGNDNYWKVIEDTK